MIIQIDMYTREYRKLNLSKKSKYYRNNLLKLGWNKNGSIDLKGINLFNELKKVKKFWEYYTYGCRSNFCVDDYVNDMMYLYGQIQRWVHEKEGIEKEYSLDNRYTRFNKN